VSKREPNCVEVTPSGIEIAYFDSVGVDGEPQQRRYLVNGEKFVNVSTILGTLSKGDALLHWAVNLTRDGQDWQEVRDEAAKRGTGAHSLLLSVLTKGRLALADLPEDHRAFGQAAFRWVRARDPKVDLIECMVACPEHGYAGRLDLIAQIDGIRTLTDWKSVTKWSYKKSKGEATDQKLPPYDENLLQLDLYQGALEASGYEPAERGLIVRLGPDGEYDETFLDLDPARGLAVLGAYQAKRGAGQAMRDAAKARKAAQAVAA